MAHDDHPGERAHALRRLLQFLEARRRENSIERLVVKFARSSVSLHDESAHKLTGVTRAVNQIIWFDGNV